jgi:cleavage and polyadenylation specificity factor subunit 3
MSVDATVLMLQWIATPVNDMFADCVLTAVLQAESLDPGSKFLPVPSKMDRMHFKVLFDFSETSDIIGLIFKVGVC